jgi:hypothetical protein
MTKRATFSQADLERALRAAKAVGYAHPTVDIRPDGTLRLLTSPEADLEASDPLAAWEREHGDRAA